MLPSIEEDTMTDNFPECSDRFIESAHAACMERVYGVTTSITDPGDWTQQASNGFLDGSWPMILAVLLGLSMIAAVLAKKL